METTKGTIYLLQPAELVGTERFKIGCSSKNDFIRCKNGYKKGTRYISVMECEEPFMIEIEIKKSFNSKFKLVAGKEYFEGNEDDIKREFNEIVYKFTILKNNTEDIFKTKELEKAQVEEKKVISKEPAKESNPYAGIFNWGDDLSKKREIDNTPLGISLGIYNMGNKLNSNSMW